MKGKNLSQAFNVPVSLKGCVHTASPTGLKQNLLPKLFTLQSGKGHILSEQPLRPGKKSDPGLIQVCVNTLDLQARFPGESERFRLIKCWVIC